MDYSKEYIKISNVILWVKNWYTHTGSSQESVMKDLKEMLKYDGYELGFISDNDVYRIIFHQYDMYYNWAIKNDVPGFNECLSSVAFGTYHNIYPNNDFRFNMLLEILAKWKFVSSEYLKLRCPHYDKHTYKIGTYKQGMTYAYMNKFAQQTFLKDV